MRATRSSDTKDDRQVPYLPRPKVIANRCKAIRQGWSEEEHLKREVGRRDPNPFERQLKRFLEVAPVAPLRRQLGHALCIDFFSTSRQDVRNLKLANLLRQIENDLGDAAVETADCVAARIRAALKVVPADRLVLAPDCGMKYLDRAAAFGKLCALADGAALVRAEIAG